MCVCVCVCVFEQIRLFIVMVSLKTHMSRSQSRGSQGKKIFQVIVFRDRFIFRGISLMNKPILIINPESKMVVFF